MKLKDIVKSGLSLLMNPEREYRRIHSRTLEEILGDYMKLLLLSGVVAGIVSFLVMVATAAYRNLLKGITVEYVRLVNYSVQILTGTFFSYIFIGTFVTFLVSVILNIFLHRLSYTDVVKIVCTSMTPLLLFSWIARITAIPLLIWSVFLIVAGIRVIEGPRAVSLPVDHAASHRSRKQAHR